MEYRVSGESEEYRVVESGESVQRGMRVVERVR